MKRILFILTFFSFLCISLPSIGQRHYRGHHYHPRKIIVVKQRPIYHPQKVVVLRQRLIHYRPQRVVVVQQRPVYYQPRYYRPAKPGVSISVNARF